MFAQDRECNWHLLPICGLLISQKSQQTNAMFQEILHILHWVLKASICDKDHNNTELHEAWRPKNISKCIAKKNGHRIWIDFQTTLELPVACLPNKWLLICARVCLSGQNLGNGNTQTAQDFWSRKFQTPNGRSLVIKRHWAYLFVPVRVSHLHFFAFWTENFFFPSAEKYKIAWAVTPMLRTPSPSLRHAAEGSAAKKQCRTKATLRSTRHETSTLVSSSPQAISHGNPGEGEQYNDQRWHIWLHQAALAFSLIHTA